MFAPIQEDIQQSLANLKSGMALPKKDFFNISWGFTFNPDTDRFLLEINAHNKKLAESLLVFREKLNAAKNKEKDLTEIINQVFLHYVINTDGLILEGEGEDPFVVFEEATAYAETLNVEVFERNGESILKLDGKEVVCPNWGVVDNWSAAWSLRQVGPVINKVRYGRNDVIPSALFDFEENSEIHTLSNAMILADFSHLAYFGSAYVEAQLSKWGYSGFHWVEDAKTDTQAFVCEKEDCIVICFRGTGSKTDWITDVKMIKTKAFGGRGRVHRGFKGALDSVWNEIQMLVDNLGVHKKIFVTGHSLGAALAQLTAYRLAFFERYTIAGVYVYGSPRVGNQSFKEAYNELLKGKSFLHINNKDIVPQVPPRILGYRHLGESPRVFGKGHQINQLPTSESGLEETVEEKEFDALDEQTQEEIKLQLEKVKTSIEASTLFLNTPPELLQAGDYQAEFAEGIIDDHSMDQYLFKFGCAIIEEEWTRMGANKGD